MLNLTVVIPDFLASILNDAIARRATSSDSVVTAALSQYFHTGRHRAYQISTSAALVQGASDGAVSSRMLLANELETAVRLKSHLVHMIWIDGSYYMVGSQERIKYSRVSGVDFGPVDPVKYAEAFGATGFRIDHPDQITTTLRKAFDTPGPVLVGVHVDYRQNVKLFEQVYEGSIL